jgi:hypothetical protein
VVAEDQQSRNHHDQTRRAEGHREARNAVQFAAGKMDSHVLSFTAAAHSRNVVLL